MKKRTNTFKLPVKLITTLMLMLFGLSFAFAQTTIPINCGGGPGSSFDSHIRFVNLAGENGTAIDYTWPLPVSNPGPTGVENQTAQVVELEMGQEYEVSFNLWSRGFTQYTSNGAIWIDFNGDGNLSPDERVHWTPPGNTNFTSGGGAQGSAPTGGVLSSRTFIVPLDANPTNDIMYVTMRAMQNETSLEQTNPCAFYTWGAMIDFTVAILPAASSPPGESTCQLICPGDMLITLNPGECCWPAMYWARTTGCDPDYQEILLGPPVLNGFTGTFDPNTFGEWDPNTTPFAIAAQEPFLMNGPGSVQTAATLGIPGIYSAITLNTVPNSIRLWGRERFTAGCAPEGTGALWNYTMINLVAPFNGTLSFDWNYQSFDISPFWDPFGYFFNGVFAQTLITNNAGPLTQSGSFTRNMNEGQSITFWVRTDDWPCSANVIMSNISFAGAAVRNGIVLVSGPALGDLICDGETQTVELVLLENGQVIDSCGFDITVQQWQTPTSTLACNDHVIISVDDECNAHIGADMILEGGPYGCYDYYSVEIFTQMPADTWGATGNVANPAQPGNYWVGVYDETGNNCWTYVTVVDKIPPQIECYCPVGGAFPAGSVVPGSIAGTFRDTDKTANIRQTCWDYGNMNLTPDFGNHYYHVYSIQADVTGDYTITGGSGNKLIVGVFNQPFNPSFPCSGMVGGTGGWIVDAKGKALYSQPGGFDMIRSVPMIAGQCYYVVVSDFDAEYTGSYSVSISGPGSLTFCKAVYSAECEFTTCYEPGVAYEFLLPEVWDNCPGAELTWTQTVMPGPDCGTTLVRRHYTYTDAAGMKASCTSEYIFLGIDLANLTWPANWDDLPNNNPMLLCNEDYPLDWNGNPHPNYTGWPEGYNEGCNTIEVFYHDQVYTSPPWGSPACGKKILREWTVVDDCTGAIFKHIQIIRITDKNGPTFITPDDIVARSKAFVCEADIVVPKIIHLTDDCDPYPKWWVTTTAPGIIVGDLNFNGFVDANETWSIVGVPMGEYTLCYHAIDNCGNETTHCIALTVIDGIPPIPVCEHYKTVSLTHEGIAMIHAKDFDSGSFDNCGPVWFKVLRVNDQFVYDGGCKDLNINKGGEIPANTSWFDDEVFFCCEDVSNEVMVTLRVFDVNPGPGPVAPGRMLPGGDLYGRYNDCWNITLVECKIPPLLYCPPITITCEDNLDPYENPAIFPEIVGLCGYEATYTDGAKSDVCSGAFNRTWVVESCGKSTQCIQRITIEDTTPFDPCTVQFPADVTTHCTVEPSATGRPTWHEYPCNIITSEIVKEDTFWFVEDACLMILREWAVIDWCVYGELSLTERTAARMNTDPITAARRINCTAQDFVEDGYYRYTQVLKMRDLIAPTIDAPDACVGTVDCYAYNVKLTATADDECNPNEEFWWKYIIIDMDSWEVIQYSYSYEPRPDQGRRGTQTEERTKLSKIKTAELTVLDPLPIGTYKVMWTAGDGCGNATTKTQTVTVADKKAPTPLMVDIATAVMENGMVALKARWFDKGGCGDGCISSFDNCTPSHLLYFTFTDMIPNLWVNPTQWINYYNVHGFMTFNPVTGAFVNDPAPNYPQYNGGTAHRWHPESRSSSRVWNCEYELGSNYYKTIQVYVWDKFALNEDCDDNNFEWANVIVNFNHCSDEPLPILAGNVPLENMNMTATHTEGTFHTKTEDGSYSMTVLSDKSYNVSGTKDTDFLNGVTTLDLVIIQKHILGLSSINDPYMLVAADINNSGTISAADLLEGRQVILGTKDRFTNNSWVALNPDYLFQNPSNAASEANNARVRNVNVGTSNVMGVNFDVVKIGDVNGTANALESRNASNLRLMTDDVAIASGQTVEIPFYAENFTEVYGAQFTMNLSGLTLEGVSSGSLAIDANNYNVVGGNLIMSFNDATGMEVSDGSLLFTLVVKSNVEANLSDVLNINDRVLRSEIYVGKDLAINTLEIGYRNSDAVYALYQNEPNPFVERTVIGFSLPTSADYVITIFDATGRTVMSTRGTGVAGYNTVTVTNSDVDVNGVLYYRLESDEFTATRKMITIK